MKKIMMIVLGIIISTTAYNQVHTNDNLWYNNGALTTIQSGCLITVQGDITNNGAGQTGIHIDNNGFVWLQGNAYGDNSFKQTGTGTLRVQNKTALYTAPYATENYQVIAGGYRVNGGKAAIAATDDGSFYNLELDNQNGLVFAKTNTDVINSVDFKPASVTVDGITIAPNGTTNRVLTYDPGTTSTSNAAPANGSNYTAVFGMMNSAAGLANFKNVSTNLTSNSTTLDNAYVQGKLRRAVNAASGGDYGFPLGLEPSSSATAARGIQYNKIDFTANTYDVVTGYFQQGSSNAGAIGLSAGCGIANCTYGTTHGEWNFTSLVAGTESYTMTIYPQDYAEVCNTGGSFAISKNDAFSGTGCGTAKLGLSRTGMTGFSDFSFVSTASILPIKIEQFSVTASNCTININWKTASEDYGSFIAIQLSNDGIQFNDVAQIKTKGDYSNYNYQLTANSSKEYYRLKLVDINGKYSFSEIKSVSNNCFTNFIKVVPTVTNNFIRVSGLKVNDEISLITATGNLIFTKKVISSGYNDINLSMFASGLYITEIKRNGVNISTTKVVKY